MWLLSLSTIVSQSDRVVSCISSSFFLLMAPGPSCSAVSLPTHLLMDSGSFLFFDSYEQSRCARWVNALVWMHVFFALGMAGPYGGCMFNLRNHQTLPKCVYQFPFPPAVRAISRCPTSSRRSVQPVSFSAVLMSPWVSLWP